jgi:iron complex transport system substrate-binding protein
LTGRQELADSVFSAICSRYDSLAVKTSGRQERVKVLMNVPYGDAWYIPGGDSYMARLVHDAGGEILGSVPGASASSAISLGSSLSFLPSSAASSKISIFLYLHISFYSFFP